MLRSKISLDVLTHGSILDIELGVSRAPGQSLVVSYITLTCTLGCTHLFV